MKKFLFTESQIKKMVDKVIVEQDEERLGIKTVQCFLNQPRILNAQLVIDGKTGVNSKTERAIMTFQTKKNKINSNIVVDGVWGYEIQKSLTPEEKKIWDMCYKKIHGLF